MRGVQIIDRNLGLTDNTYIFLDMGYTLKTKSTGKGNKDRKIKKNYKTGNE
jgi:hypothetical protein